MGQLITSIIAFFINSWYCKKFIDYGTFDQLKDLFPTLALSMLMNIAISQSMHIATGDLARLVLSLTVGVSIYTLGSFFISRDEMKEIKSLVLRR